MREEVRGRDFAAMPERMGGDVVSLHEFLLQFRVELVKGGSRIGKQSITASALKR